MLAANLVIPADDVDASPRDIGSDRSTAPDAVHATQDWEDLRLALAASQERLSLAVDSGGVGLWEIDFRTGRRWFSDTAATIMGHPLNEPLDETQSLAAVHPDDQEMIRTRMSAMVRMNAGVDTEFEYRLSRSDREGPMWAVSTGRVLRDKDGIAQRIVGSVRDVTVSRRQRDELARMAFQDESTKLPNRRGLLRWLSQASETDPSLALLLLDVDDFKRTIGQLGSAAAETLIRQVAARLRAAMPSSKFVARLDGDEFAVATPGGAIGGKWSRVAKSVHSALKRPFLTDDGRVVFIEVTIGAASLDQVARSIEDLMAMAVLSLREAKVSARGSTQQFTPAMQSVREKVQTVLSELPEAVTRGEFILPTNLRSTLPTAAFAAPRRSCAGTIPHGDSLPRQRSSTSSHAAAGPRR